MHNAFWNWQRESMLRRIKLSERKSQHLHVPEVWHLRWLMLGLIMLRNCFRSQGNVAMWVRISATGHGTVMKQLFSYRICLVEKSGQEYITAFWCWFGFWCDASFISYIVYRCKHLYNTWCQSGPYMELVVVLGWNRQTFYQGLWKSNFLLWNCFGSALWPTLQSMYHLRLCLLTVKGSKYL